MLLQLQDQNFIARIDPLEDSSMISVLLLRAGNNQVLAGMPIMFEDRQMALCALEDTSFLTDVANDLYERYTACAETCMNVKQYSYCEFESPEYVFGSI